MRLEVVNLPVADVDRARRSYEHLGWRLDADLVLGPDLRISCHGERFAHPALCPPHHARHAHPGEPLRGPRRGAVEETSYAIVGGGISGLTYYLARQ